MSEPTPAEEPKPAEEKKPEQAAEEKKPELPPLRSVHTTSFPAILQHLRCSILVTTYQAGKLVVLRADNGVLNTHFRAFAKPMGLALDRDRLAVGTAMQVWEFHNVPAVTRRLEPPEKHDACFLPRMSHVTGDVQIHEMAWAGDELWFVNTRFSCLCTIDGRNSFVPRWRPPFITGLSPEDRCHLNGLGMVEGRPRIVTALGTSDTPAGWRPTKKDGGMLMDITSNEMLLTGLSMPHSPRFYNGRLWLLESGNGTIGTVDVSAKKYTPICDLPGFTRGIDFADRFAFIGLSQVRETAVFSGIAIAERALAERNCGVWVVDITNGQIVAFVKFEDAVQEIFAVTVVPGVAFPDLINDNDQLIADSFVLPDEALQAVPETLRQVTKR
jgi:uncharacterized protein (TIGR03032 family)